jgi:hypothetical protein
MPNPTFKTAIRQFEASKRRFEASKSPFEAWKRRFEIHAQATVTALVVVSYTYARQAVRDRGMLLPMTNLMPAALRGPTAGGATWQGGVEFVRS